MVESDEMNIIQVAKECTTLTELLDRITLPQSDLDTIRNRTVGQSSNKFWHTVRRGRITASNFYRVHTKVESLKKDPTVQCSSLIESLINPPSLGHLPQISKGITTENAAVSAFINALAASGHNNVTVQPCGFYIAKDKQFLGASPDGLVQCDCCPVSLLEIKCPSKELSKLPYLTHDKKLKTKSPYYGQVQGQMAVTGIHSSHFFVFYAAGIHNLECIKYNTDFSNSMLANLEFFYMHHLAPKLMSRKKHKAQ